MKISRLLQGKDKNPTAVWYDDVMKILFVRHGESEANAKLYVGAPESPLSEKGLEQARITGQKL
jgi:hypothetical protein